VDHTCQHSQVHGVTGVENLPLGADARIHQDVVGTGQLQEEDVEQVCGAAHLLGHRTGAKYHASNQIPYRNVRGNVDLLGGVTHSPPYNTIHLSIDMADISYRPEEGWDQDDGA